MFHNPKNSIILILVSISCSLIFLDSTGGLDFVIYPLRRLLAPVQYFGNNLVSFATAPFDYLRFIRSGEARIKYLEQKNIELTLKVLDDKQLREENADLHQQLGANVAKKHVLVPAKVLGINRFLEIQNEGNGGLKIGQSVVWGNNFLGVIIKTNDDIAFVRLVSDPDSKIPARTSSATGIVLGQFSSGLFLDKVSKDEYLSVDDLVTTSGAASVTPPDLAIGKVDRIVSSTSDLFQKASLRSLIEAKDLKIVYVVAD